MQKEQYINCKCGCGNKVLAIRRYTFFDKRRGREYERTYKSKGYCIGHNPHDGINNGMFSKKRSAEEKALISLRTKQAMAQDGISEHISKMKKKLWANPKKRAALMEALNRGKRTPEFHSKRSVLSKEISNRPYVKEIMRRTVIRSLSSGKLKYRLKPSSIELPVKKILKELGVKFKQQAAIRDISIADFQIGDKLIYCDGVYWHGLEKVRARDIRVNKELENFGYKILRLKENEIKKYNSLVKQKIKLFVQG